MATTLTEPGRAVAKYCESPALKHMRRQARTAPPQHAREAWKQVAKQRQRETRAWYKVLVDQASTAHWQSKRALDHHHARWDGSTTCWMTQRGRASCKHTSRASLPELQPSAQPGTSETPGRPSPRSASARRVCYGRVRVCLGRWPRCFRLWVSPPCVVPGPPRRSRLLRRGASNNFNPDQVMVGPCHVSAPFQNPPVSLVLAVD